MPDAWMIELDAGATVFVVAGLVIEVLMAAEERKANCPLGVDVLAGDVGDVTVVALVPGASDPIVVS